MLIPYRRLYACTEFVSADAMIYMDSESIGEMAVAQLVNNTAHRIAESNERFIIRLSPKYIFSIFISASIQIPIAKFT